MSDIIPTACDYVILVHLNNAKVLRTMLERIDLPKLVSNLEKSISLPRLDLLMFPELRAVKENQEMPLIVMIVATAPEMDYAITVRDLQTYTINNSQLKFTVTLCRISDMKELAEYFVFNGGGQEQDVSCLIPAMRQAMNLFYSCAKKINDRSSIVDEP